MRDETFEWLSERAIPEPNSGCWLWLGTMTRRRNRPEYGVATLRGKTRNALRAAYLIDHRLDDLPRGIEVDHLCMNKPCANPDHGEAVDRVENQNRWVKARFGRRPDEVVTLASLHAEINRVFSVDSFGSGASGGAPPAVTPDD